MNLFFIMIGMVMMIILAIPLIATRNTILTVFGVIIGIAGFYLVTLGVRL